MAEPALRKTDADVAWSPPALPDCTCRAKGKNFQVGESVCLSTPDGFRMAQCELTQNVTNWHFSSDGCVTSQRGKPGTVSACFGTGSRRI